MIDGLVKDAVSEPKYLGWGLITMIWLLA